MSHYIYDVEPATCHIKKKKLFDLFFDIKFEARKPKWKNYGWYGAIEKAETIYDIAKEFGIELVDSKKYVTPRFNDTYASSFFPSLAEIAAPYMEDGCLYIDDEYEKLKYIYKNGKLEISEE